MFADIITDFFSNYVQLLMMILCVCRGLPILYSLNNERSSLRFVDPCRERCIFIPHRAKAHPFTGSASHMGSDKLYCPICFSSFPLMMFVCLCNECVSSVARSIFLSQMKVFPLPFCTLSIPCCFLSIPIFPPVHTHTVVKEQNWPQGQK